MSRLDRVELDPLPIGAGITATAAVSGLGVRDLLPTPVVWLWVLLAVVAVASVHRWPAGRPAAHRRMVAESFATLTLVPAVGWVVLALRPVSAPADLVLILGSSLGYPLAAVLVAQLAAVTSLRELGVVLVGSLLAAVLAIGTMPAPAGQDTAFGLCLAVGCVAGLVTVWMLLDAREWVGETHVLRGRTLAPVRGLPVLVAGATLLALLALLLPHPDGYRSFGVAEAGGGGSSTSGGLSVRRPQSYLSGGMDLNARGDLPSSRLVDVPADSPRLWGSTQLDTYDGRTWGGSAPAGGLVPRDAAGDYDLRQGVVPGLASGRADRTDMVRPVEGAFLPLLAPGQAVSVRIDDAVAANRTRAIPLTPGSPYVIRSTGSIRDAVTTMDTQLPSSLPVRVLLLARRLARGAPTTTAKVVAIESYLREHERYRLDSPVPDDGEDAVDDFLFVSHEGFCEHFASAEAVLLRAMDVPARIVTGFAGGTYEGDRRVMLGKDAHAWVQVHVGGGAWVWTDPTAGAEPVPDRPAARSSARWHAALAIFRAHWRLLGLLGAGAGLLTLGTLLVVRRIRRRRAVARARAAPLATQVLAAFAAYEDVVQGTALARPSSASVQELAVRLTVRWPGGLPDADRARAALTVVEQVLYDGRPVPAERLRDAIATLVDLTACAEEARKVVLTGRA